MITESKLKSGTLTLGPGVNDLTAARVATTANLTLSAAPATIDGVTMVASDRVLVKDQTLPAANGVYVWVTLGAAMTRATDADTSAEMVSGTYVPVTEGTVGGGNNYVLTTANPIVLGTTALTFAETAATSGPGTEFSCQATNVRLTPSADETGDEVETLCGDIIGAETKTSWVLAGSSIQDFDDPDGFVLYCFTHDLDDVAFSWNPSATSGTWSGTVQIKAVEIGGDVNTRLSTDWEWRITGTGIPTLTPLTP